MTFLSELLAKTPAARTKPITESVFAVWPELFSAQFWERMQQFAKDPGKAQDVINELDKLGAQGATVSPVVAKNLMKTMQTARLTLRNASLKRRRDNVMFRLKAILAPIQFLFGTR